MMNLKYKIKPTITFENKELWIFNSELLQMDIQLIQDGIDSCQLTIEEKNIGLSWGLEVSELKIGKEISILTYHGKFVAEIPTIEIYNMLKAYRDKLKDYENENNTS